MDYASYLKLDTLLSAQAPESARRGAEAHDEMLFIVIHQVYELWFKQILHELERVARIFSGRVVDDAELSGAVHGAERVVRILQLVVSQIDVLETMTPMDFLAFRDKLQPASGFQSAQFREFEYALGIRDAGYLKNYESDSESRERLEGRLAAPPVPEAFFALLRDRGFDAPPLPNDADDDDRAAIRETRVAAVSRLYAEFESHYDLFLLAEALIEMDQQLMLWRQRHVVMVERVIGGRRGTGGSSGAGYLKTTLEKRAFPELWDLRTSMSVHHSY